MPTGALDCAIFEYRLVASHLVLQCTNMHKAVASAKATEGRWCSKANDSSRKNAANENLPSTMPRINEITNAGPCARCDETDKMLPSRGKTASRPLQVAPAQPDSEVTIIVSSAPAAILPMRSALVSGEPAATAVLRGRNVWPKQTATNAMTVAHKGDAGTIDKQDAATSHAAKATDMAIGHERERQVHE